MHVCVRGCVCVCVRACVCVLCVVHEGVNVHHGEFNFSVMLPINFGFVSK